VFKFWSNSGSAPVDRCLDACDASPGIASAPPMSCLDPCDASPEIASAPPMSCLQESLSWFSYV